MPTTFNSPALRCALMLGCLLVSTGSQAGERGAVTAVSASGSQASAFIGYTSGAVLYCTRLSGCTQLEGTPDSAVTALDALSEGGSIRAWVGYENGSVYFCTLTGDCILQKEHELNGEADTDVLKRHPRP